MMMTMTSLNCLKGTTKNLHKYKILIQIKTKRRIIKRGVVSESTNIHRVIKSFIYARNSRKFVRRKIKQVDRQKNIQIKRERERTKKMLYQSFNSKLPYAYVQGLTGSSHGR